MQAGRRNLSHDPMFYILIVVFPDFMFVTTHILYLGLVNLIVCYLYHREADKKEI